MLFRSFLLLCVPLFTLIGVTPLVIIISFLISSLTLTSLRFNKYELLISYFSGFFSLLVLPISILTQKSCSNLDYVPWLFNGLLGPIFLSTIISNRRFLKWLNPAGYFAESLLLARELPEQCSDLLVGSIPGIILISVLAILALWLRRKNERSDESIIDHAQKKLNLLDSGLRASELERQKMLVQIKSKLVDQQFSSVDSFKLETDFQIRRVRNFLIMVEYFDQPVIRKIYNFLKSEKLNDSDFSVVITRTDEIDWMEKLDTDQIFAALEKQQGNKGVLQLNPELKDSFRFV